MTNQVKKIPEFAVEADKRAFWESQDSADYMDQGQASRVTELAAKHENHSPSSSGAFAGLDQGRRECATRTASVSYKNLVAGKNSQQIMLCITGAV
jgi:hypothetical protein